MVIFIYIYCCKKMALLIHVLLLRTAYLGIITTGAFSLSLTQTVIEGECCLKNNQQVSSYSQLFHFNSILTTFGKLTRPGTCSRSMNLATPELNPEIVQILYSSIEESIWVYDIKDSNGILERCLSFTLPTLPISTQEDADDNDDTVETCIYLREPHWLTISYLKILAGSLYLTNHINSSSINILMIGLGGGALPSALNSIMPNLKLDIVEINPTIVYIAQSYFYFKPSPTTRIFIQDGAEFIYQQLHLQSLQYSYYDIIIIDAFDGGAYDELPASFCTKEFVINLKRVLRPNTGVVGLNIYNRHGIHDGGSMGSGNVMINLIKDIFIEVISIIEDDDYEFEELNQIIFAINNNNNGKSNLNNLTQIKEQAKLWEQDFNKININTSWLVNKFIQP